MVARRLARSYRGAAWVEALLRYHAHRTAGRPWKAAFYREVLVRLGADNLVDHRPTPLAVAELYAQHLDDPALEAAGRADEAAVEGDPALRAFWIEVHRQVEVLAQAPRGGDGER